MSFIIIIVTAITISIVLAVIFNLNFKHNKELAKNENLNNIAEKFPQNIDICKTLLKKLNNENVNIEENDGAKDCLYIAVTNKIVIAGTQTNFTRIQTIAHECIHSIQDRRIQIANFIVSNICIIYFVVISLLALLKLLPDKLLFLNIYIMLAFFSFIIREYLENDAMIKAKFLAKEYMEGNDYCSKDEIQQLVNGFEQINNMGIKGVNYSLFLSVLIRTIILSLLFIIR